MAGQDLVGRRSSVLLQAISCLQQPPFSAAVGSLHKLDCLAVCQDLDGSSSSFRLRGPLVNVDVAAHFPPGIMDHKFSFRENAQTTASREFLLPPSQLIVA